MHKSVIAALATLSLAVSPAASLAGEALTLDALAPEHRQQVTCMMLAGVAVNEFERGVRKHAYGLDKYDLERLGDSLFAVLKAAYGVDAETVRGLISAQYEQSSARVIELVQEDPDAPEELFEEIAEGCKSFWEEGAAPPPPSYYDKPVDAYFCFALESAFARAIAEQAGGDTEVSLAFARRANRIEAALLEEAGEDRTPPGEVSDALASLANSFDIAAWDALPEQEAEAIMTWCDDLAGPDD